MNFINQKIYYLPGSFLAGFSLMVVELVSARIVAPMVGSSVFTWTSVIGVTLLGLSVGSFVGGKLADIKNEKYSGVMLPLSFFVSALLVSTIPFLIKTTSFILEISNSVIFLNIFISLYLFLLPTFFLGTIQPILLKKYARDFSNIGKEYGTLSSIWSIGSIFGVFLTGFFLISYVGSKETLWIVAGLLFITSLIFSYSKKCLFIYILATGLFFIFFIGLFFHTNNILTNNVVGKASVLFDSETDYYHTRVADVDLEGFGKSRVLALDFDIHSINSSNTNQYFYTEIYPVFQDIKSNIGSILTIGSGAYTLPEHFSQFYPSATISVMETDPALVSISEKYFGLNPTKIKTQVGDARILLPKSKQKYDLIFGDAYNSFISVPWYLLTKEWNDEVKSKISEGGMYAVNFIGSTDGPGSLFTKSVIKTFKLTFPNYYVFVFSNDKKSVQNVVLIGINGQLPLSEKDLYNKIALGKNQFLAKRLFPVSGINTDNGTVLSDNFAPVERLTEPLVKSYFPEYLSFMNEIF